MKKSLLYMIIALFGIALIVSGIVLDGKASDTVQGMFIGIGAGLMGVGLSMWLFFRQFGKDSAKWKQYDIESNDERNIFIKLRAKAAAGEVLQWTVLAAVWAAIFLGAPLWIILAGVGIFTVKIILELCLMVRYQKEM